MDEFLEVLDAVELADKTIDLVEDVRSMFRGESLHLLHRQCLDLTQMNVAENDQDTPFHKQFYSQFAQAVANYRRVVFHSIVNSNGDPGKYAFQKIPTFRIHVPGGIATKEFHKDTDYNHPRKEVNFIVPLTNFIMHDENRNGNGVLVEYAPSLYFAPALVPGQVLRFKGTEMRHGSRRNDTPYSRVSIDFRVIKIDDLENVDPETRTVNSKKRFIVGEYYDIF